MMRIVRLLTVGLIGGLVLVAVPHATTLSPAGTSISGGGTFNATDDFGGTFPAAGQFTINAGLRPDGTPYGSLDLVGRGDFAAAWGACPYDPRCEDFPNTSTQIFHLSGEVTSLTTAGSDVIAAGLLSERDHGQGDGVIFEESDVQFSVVASEGSQSVVFQFCLVPPFTLEIAKGTLSVSVSSPQASLFQRPAQHPLNRMMPCHAPQASAR